MLTGEPDCREWAARESALAAQDLPSVIAPYSHTRSRCMHVHMYLWRGDWHHWWLWGGGQLHCPRLVPGVVGVPTRGTQ